MDSRKKLIASLWHKSAPKTQLRADISPGQAFKVLQGLAAITYNPPAAQWWLRIPQWVPSRVWRGDMCHKPEGTGMPGVLIIGTKYGSPESLGLCFPLAKPRAQLLKLPLK